MWPLQYINPSSYCSSEIMNTLFRIILFEYTTPLWVKQFDNHNKKKHGFWLLQSIIKQNTSSTVSWSTCERIDLKTFVIWLSHLLVLCLINFRLIYSTNLNHSWLEVFVFSHHLTGEESDSDSDEDLEGGVRHDLMMADEKVWLKMGIGLEP